MAFTAESLARVARISARTHRGETPLQFHLSQWAEECNEYSREENILMCEAAHVLLEGVS